MLTATEVKLEDGTFAYALHPVGTAVTEAERLVVSDHRLSVDELQALLDKLPEED